MRKQLSDSARSSQWRYFRSLENSNLVASRSHDNLQEIVRYNSSASSNAIVDRRQNHNNVQVEDENIHILEPCDNQDIFKPHIDTNCNDECDIDHESDIHDDNDDNDDEDDDNDDDINPDIDDNNREENDVFDSTYSNVECENFDKNILYDQSIYEGAPINVAASMMMMLNLSMKHKLTDTCIDDIFTVIKRHCLPKKLKNLNLYHFKNFFKFEKSSVKKHYYCPKCESILPHQSCCNQCLEQVQRRYFVTLSIIDQLKLIIGKMDNYNFLNKRNERIKQNIYAIEDLYDGNIYKTVGDFLSNLNNCSFTWCTDGVPVFKSTKINIWPFYLRINEFPFDVRIRRENTILAALWFGGDKPIPNMILESMMTEFEQIFNGISINISNCFDITLRALLLCGTCDLPAKSLFLNISQYNGRYGCPYCEHATQRVNIREGKSINVYSFTNNLVLRTLPNTLEYAKRSVENRNEKASNKRNTNVMGIKGPSYLSLMMPNYIEGTSIDAMHAIYEGIAKKMIKLWVDSTFSTMPFSLRQVLNEIDLLLLKIKPPRYIHRTPRSITKYFSWKASELKCWLFYYSVPIMEEFLRPDYFQNYLKLVTACSILNSNSIQPIDLNNAETLLSEFVKEFQDLYGLKYCSINVHQLLHIVENVRRFGNLWVLSCFSFEDLNGQILQDIHGTTNIESQIAKSHFHMLKFSHSLDGMPNMAFSNCLLRDKRQVRIMESFNECHSVGTYKKFDEILFNDMFRSTRKYFRLLKNNYLYISEEYRDNLKSDSSNAKFLFGNEECFGKIIYFIKVSNCDCTGDKCLCSGQHFAKINILEVSAAFRDNISTNLTKMFHIMEYHPTNNVEFIPVENLIYPCIIILNSNSSYLVQPINTFERE